MSKEFPTIPPPDEQPVHDQMKEVPMDMITATTKTGDGHGTEDGAGEAQVNIEDAAAKFEKLKAEIRVLVGRYNVDSVLQILDSLREERELAREAWSVRQSAVLMAAYLRESSPQIVTFETPLLALVSAYPLADLSLTIAAFREAVAQEEEERYRSFMEAHPDTIMESRRECGTEVAIFEGMIKDFEATYSLEALLSITELSVEDAPKHPIREPAKEALVPIVALLNALKDETNISTDEYERLRAQYKRLSQAVGMINGGRVDHTR